MTASPTFEAVIVGPGDEQTTKFGLLIVPGELPVVRAYASSEAELEELRAWVTLPSTRQAIFDAIFDALEQFDRPTR